MRGKVKRWLLSIAAVVVIAALLAGPAAACRRAPQQWQEEFRFPAIGTKSGVLARYGQDYIAGQELAVEKINAEGGINGKPLVFDWEYSDYDPARATSLVRKHVDKALVILGPFFSAEGESAAPVANAAGVPILTAWASNPAVVELNRPWSFTFTAPDILVAQAAVDKWLKQLPQVKTVVLQQDNTDSAIMSSAAVVSQLLEAHGIRILEKTYHAVGDLDFSAQVSKAKALRPDAVVIASFGTEAGAILKEMKKQRHDVPVLLTVTSFAGRALWESGGDAVNGVWAYSAVWEDNPDSEYQRFYTEWKNRTGSRIYTDVVAGYDAMMALAHVLKTKGITGNPANLKEERAKIRDGIAALKDFPGLQGPLTMTDKGYPDRGAYLFHIEDLKAVPK